MKSLICTLIAAIALLLPELATAQIPIPRYLRELPKEEAKLHRERHNSNRDKARKAAGISGTKEYKKKEGGAKRLVREYFFDQEGRYSKVEVYSPDGAMGEIEEIEYHPGTSDQKQYARYSVDEEGRKETRELFRYTPEGETIEKIDLGGSFKPEITRFRFGKDGKVVEELVRKYENGAAGDTVSLVQTMPSALAPQSFIAAWFPSDEQYIQAIKTFTSDGDEEEVLVVSREWGKDRGVPPMVYDADGNRAIRREDVHIYYSGGSPDIDPPFEISSHIKYSYAGKGKVTSRTYRIASGEFVTTSSSTYDKEGRILTSTRFYQSGESETQTFKYSPEGWLINIEDDNTIHTLEYHPNGTVKRYFLDNQSGQPNFHTFEELYGEDGRVLWNEDKVGVMGSVKWTRNEHQYDDDGVLVKITATSSTSPTLEVTFEVVE